LSPELLTRFGRTKNLAGVLGHAELIEPIGDLLHRGSAPDYRASSARAGNFTQFRAGNGKGRSLPARCRELSHGRAEGTEGRARGCATAAGNQRL